MLLALGEFWPSRFRDLQVTSCDRDHRGLATASFPDDLSGVLLPLPVRNAFNGTCRGSVPSGPCLPMEAANFVSPDSHGTRAPRYPYPRDIFALPASLPSAAVAAANIRELYPSIALVIPKTRVHYLSSRTLQIRAQPVLRERRSERAYSRIIKT